MTGKIVEPRVNIPPIIEQGDTVTWVDYPFTDLTGSVYDATGYTLTYTIAGANAPLIAPAMAEGTSWQMALTASQTSGVAVGKNWWQAALSAAGFNLVVARGDLTIDVNLALVSAGYSGLSATEQSLNAWQAAMSALSGTNGPAVESYRIGDREMRYRDMNQIMDAIGYWQAKLVNEKTANSIAQGKGNPRKLYARFPSRYGSNS